MNSHIYLTIAIIAEIIATTSLKLSDGFTKFVPSVFVFVGYIISFGVLSLALKEMQLGVAYAIWSAVGTAGMAIIGFALWKEPLTASKLLALALIIIGVIILETTSTSQGA
ncbi:multidrug efflux SMR transporter [Anaerolineales bacterium]